MKHTVVNFAPKILGFTDSVCSCDRCGKQGLKGTYAIETHDSQILYLGSTCIAHRMEFSVKETQVFIKSELQKRKEEKQAAIKEGTKELEEEMAAIRAQYDKDYISYCEQTRKDYSETGSQRESTIAPTPVIRNKHYRKIWDSLTAKRKEIEATFQF